MGTGTELAEREVLQPELVDGVPEKPPWDESCPVCTNHWAKGPEQAQWYRGHCWSCGYSPNKPVTGFVVQAQPDWGQLVKDAVREALFSEPQKLAEMLTATLGKEGMAALAEREQAGLGFDPRAGAAGPEA